LGAGQPAENVLADFAPDQRDSIQVILRLTGEADLIDQYARHDVFLMPSLSEGSSLALLEAMAAGMAVVATRVGGIPDVIAHEINGVLFEPANIDDGAAQVCRLLAQHDLSERLGEAARTSTEKLGWPNSCLVFLSAVQKAVENSSHPAVPEECPRHTAL
jgi:glycosyltransferase involved in cell wall biosynthesis